MTYPDDALKLEKATLETRLNNVADVKWQPPPKEALIFPDRYVQVADWDTDADGQSIVTFRLVAKLVMTDDENLDAALPVGTE